MKSREVLAAALAVLMAVPCAVGVEQQFQAKLSKGKQIQHAIDRLTFGPRPGDLEKVKRIGIKKWIDLQLQPEQIEENAFLLAKLAPLESLRMSSQEVAQHYPPPQMIKAIAAGRQPMPDDPMLRASITRLVARYRNKSDDLEPLKTLDQVLDPAQIKALRSGTPDQKRALLATLPASQLDDLVVALPRPLRQQLFLFAPVDVRRKMLLLNAPQQVVAYDLLESKLLRAVYSNRQLAEELDDFWFNHFNVFYDKGADRFTIPAYERDAIRPNVLGHFRTLLEATAKSPAMLFYLDNFQSMRPDIDAKAKNRKTKRGLNENYARELMELHTLGVNGGYTQQDVIEVARCFTGWTIEAPRKGAGFWFNDKIHDTGEKVVLGHVIPAGGGIEDGEKVLDILASHPSTARFLSRELAQRFLSDDPPQAVLNRMSATFLKTGGDIRQVMRTLLTSKEFWSEGAYRAKVKTPLEMVASAVRAVDAKVDDAYALANQIGQLGQPLYRKLEPTGYSNLNADWVNSAALLGRMNFALSLAQNKVPGVKVDPAKLAALQVLELSPQTRGAIDQALKTPQTPPAELLAGLVMGSPEFQRR